MAEQDKNGQTAFYLIKVGMFYHAYECGAFALSRLLDYRVIAKPRKNGSEVLQLGFPVSALPKVAERIEEAGGIIRPEDTEGRLYLFSGICGTPDPDRVERPAPKDPTPELSDIERQVIDRLLSFDVARSCPISALLLIEELQRELLFSTSMPKI